MDEKEIRQAIFVSYCLAMLNTFLLLAICYKIFIA